MCTQDQQKTVNNCNLPNGGLATVDVEGFDGGPTPALFSALTLYWYSVPGVRLVEWCVSSDVFVSVTHLVEYLSFLSRMYCLMAAPPSDLGGCQDTVISWRSTLEISGASGASGTSAKLTAINNVFVIKSYNCPFLRQQKREKNKDCT